MPSSVASAIATGCAGSDHIPENLLSENGSKEPMSLRRGVLFTSGLRGIEACQGFIPALEPLLWLVR
jgi:hypothetical protein